MSANNDIGTIPRNFNSHRCNVPRRSEKESRNTNSDSLEIWVRFNEYFDLEQLKHNSETWHKTSKLATLSNQDYVTVFDLFIYESHIYKYSFSELRSVKWKRKCWSLGKVINMFDYIKSNLRCFFRSSFNLMILRSIFAYLANSSIIEICVNSAFKSKIVFSKVLSSGFILTVRLEIWKQ